MNRIAGVNYHCNGKSIAYVPAPLDPKHVLNFGGRGSFYLIDGRLYEFSWCSAETNKDTVDVDLTFLGPGAPPT